MRITKLLWIVAVLFSIHSCKSEKVKSIFFNIEDDKTLGQQVADEIAANPSEYPVLSRTQYANAYNYLFAIRDKILNAGKVAYKDEFEWQTFIIQDDSILNAFCTPGGYIYVYTGLIKYLDSEEQLAGVMGHEIAHADRRHTIKSLEKQYGTQFLLDVVLGKDESALKTVTAGVISLKNSKDHEKEADEYSVIYMCPTNYQADGAADFFQKLIDQGYTQNSLETFFSTHPSPDNRVEAIQAKKSDLTCSGDSTFTTQYAAFKKMLP
jgi:beta-barrel assembly-enhancing protease